jgi:DNA-binding GntR family transcriptional regulator
MIYKQQNLSGATQRVYDHLFGEIISGRLPPGLVLSEAEIAKNLQSSRTPVREVLMILESYGLVKRYPGRGCFVAEITQHDVEEIFELRLQLELCALRNAYARISSDQLIILERQLLELTPDSDPNDYYVTDRALHELLFSYCGNSRLVDFLGILNGQIERVRCISAMRPSRLLESRAEHLEIVHAIRDGDLPKTEEMLTRHILNVRDSTVGVCLQMSVREHTVTI